MVSEHKYAEMSNRSICRGPEVLLIAVYEARSTIGSYNCMSFLEVVCQPVAPTLIRNMLGPSQPVLGYDGKSLQEVCR